MDPNTLNLDPDPECWFNLDPGYAINFEKIIKNEFREKQFKIFFLNYKKIMAPEELFIQLSV